MRRTATRTDKMAMMTTVPALCGPGAACSATAEGCEGGVAQTGREEQGGETRPEQEALEQPPHQPSLALAGGAHTGGGAPADSRVVMVALMRGWPILPSPAHPQESPRPQGPLAPVFDLLIWPHTLLQAGLAGPLCLSHRPPVTHHQELHSEETQDSG